MGARGFEPGSRVDVHGDLERRFWLGGWLSACAGGRVGLCGDERVSCRDGEEDVGGSRAACGCWLVRGGASFWAQGCGDRAWIAAEDIEVGRGPAGSEVDEQMFADGEEDGAPVVAHASCDIFWGSGHGGPP